MRARGASAIVLVDGDERIEVEFGTDLWRAAMEWATFHGLDPERIPAGSEIVRDAASRCIRYDEYVFAVPSNRRTLRLDAAGRPILKHCVEQGEAAPLPFPRTAS